MVKSASLTMPVAKGIIKPIFEASIKVPIEQAAVAAGGFLAHLAEIGAERDHAQEAKTRWALEHYAGKSRRIVAKAGGGKSAAPVATKGSQAAAAKKTKVKTAGTKVAARKSAKKS